MQYNKMGQSCWYVSRICLGTMAFGRLCDETESFRILDEALDNGITFFDSANAYGGGASEEIIGKWFAQGLSLIHICMAWQNIRHNQLRSFLTVLGIVIGVAAIIALISMVQGVMGAINQKFIGLGACLLYTSPRGPAQSPGPSAGGGIRSHRQWRAP